MTKRFKKLVSLMVMAFVLLSHAAIGETSSGAYARKTKLTQILEEGLFSAFSTDNSYYQEIDFLGMCHGQVLRDCYVSSEFGVRNHPIRWRRHLHTGIDLAAPKGTPVFAPADGVVKVVGRGRGYGRLIELDHGFAWNTKYAHLSKILVKKGQIIKQGDIIGEVGSSGVSTGPHLHFEMIYFGSVVNPRSHFAALDTVGSPSMAFANR